MEFVVENRVITCTNGSLIGDNADYIASFIFDSEWEDEIKVARFIKNGKYIDVPVDEDNRCPIPVTLLKKGFLSVGVYASKITTTPCEVYIEESIKDSGELFNCNEGEGDIDIIHQILEKLSLAEYVENKISLFNEDGSVRTDITEKMYANALSLKRVFDIVSELGVGTGVIQEKITWIMDTLEAIDTTLKKDIPDTYFTQQSAEVLKTTINQELDNKGSSITMEVDDDYVLTLKLKTGEKELSETSVDLPLETMVVGAEYDNTNKKIILKLRDGHSTVDVPVGDLVNGLVSTTELNAILQNYLLISELGSKLTELGFINEGDVKELLKFKQDKLTAGKDITIDENNVISLADDFIADVPFASSSQAGIIKIPLGCGIRQDGNDGSVKIDFPIEEITCQDKSIDITKGSNSRNIEVNKSFINGYVKDLAHKSEVEKKSDKTYVDGELAKKQNNLTAGAGISINEDNVISTSAHFQVEVVRLNEDGLPNVNEPNSQVLYLTHNTQTENWDWYNEWLWIYDIENESFRWEKIGSTQVDLSGYAQKSELPTKTSDLTNDSNFVSDENYVHTDNNFTTAEKQKLGTLANYDDTTIKEQIAGKQDELTAGENITIDKNSVISANVITDYNNLTNQPFKNLALSVTKDTMLTDIADGCYIISEKGYIKTTNGRMITLGVGSELMINTYNGVKAGTFQTGKGISSFNDNFTTKDKLISWLNTSHKDLQITENATDDTIPTSKAVKDYVDNLVANKIDKSQVGNGLKFENGQLQLDIPVASASTTYGGDTQ